jgi:hypothetical protein
MDQIEKANHISVLIKNHEVSTRSILGLPNLVRIIRELKKIGVRQITIANWNDEKLRPILKKYQVMHLIHPSVNVPDNSNITIEGECYYSKESLKDIVHNPYQDLNQTLKAGEDLWWQRLDDGKYSYKKVQDKILKNYFKDQVFIFYFPFIFSLFSLWAKFQSVLNLSFKTYHFLMVSLLVIMSGSFFILDWKLSALVFLILMILKQSLDLKSYLKVKLNHYQLWYFISIISVLYLSISILFLLKENYSFYYLLYGLSFLSIMLVAFFHFYQSRFELDFYPKLFKWFENKNIQNVFLITLLILFSLFLVDGLFWFLNISIIGVVFYYFISMFMQVLKTNHRANN